MIDDNYERICLVTKNNIVFKLENRVFSVYIDKEGVSGIKNKIFHPRSVCYNAPTIGVIDL